MLPPIAYLDFAGRWYGQVSHDLATSGVTQVGEDALGAGAAVADLGARERFRGAVATRYGVPASEVVTTLGASGALFVAHATLQGPDRRLLVESPSYEPVWRGAEAKVSFMEEGGVQATYSNRVKKWQALPASTNRCQMPWPWRTLWSVA